MVEAKELPASSPRRYSEMVGHSDGGRLGRVLNERQQKSLKTDRITLVLGPLKELETVRLIFALSAEGRSCTEIVRELDRRGSVINGKPWNDLTVLQVLTNPK